MAESEEALLLTAAEEQRLALAIEAGVLAQEVLDGRVASSGPAGSWAGSDAASIEELRALVCAGEAARRRFVEANLGLARMVTRQLAARSAGSSADVYQEACLGLLVAVRRFDCRRGFRFATYALFWIRAYAVAATAATAADSTLSAGRAAQLRMLRGVQSQLTQSLGRAATANEVAATVGRPRRYVADLLAHRASASLTGVEAAVPDPVPAGDGATAVQLLGRLSGLRRQVLELRLGFATGRPVGYAAIGRQLELTVGRVRRLEQAALDELRDVCPYDLVES
jgi:RNA polymerase primary sigma factor/RNA polymerase nonessential primary-like sigma factor